MKNPPTDNGSTEEPNASKYINLLRILKGLSNEEALSYIHFLAADPSYPPELLTQILDLSRPIEVQSLKIKGYNIVKHLGTGSGGMVFLAEDIELNKRKVAIKIPIYESLLGDGFRKELAALTSLQHTFITKIHKILNITINNIPRLALILEYIPKPQHLDTYCNTKPDHDKLRVFLEVCEAVSHAHKEGLIHCDLKPHNILVGADGHAKVLDFGLARFLNKGIYSGEILGTPAFMSPEAASGTDLDIRTDIYSLGIILYILF